MGSTPEKTEVWRKTKEGGEAREERCSVSVVIYFLIEHEPQTHPKVCTLFEEEN